MRKRKSKTDPDEQLIALGHKWRRAVLQGNPEQALAIRKQAAPLFEALPKRRQRPPSCPKGLYLDWQSFVYFEDKKTRELFIDSIN